MALESLSSTLRRRQRSAPEHKDEAASTTKPETASDTKADPNKIEPDGIADQVDQGLSETCKLWLQSHWVPGKDTYRPMGDDRPLSWANIKIAAQLVWLTCYRFLSLFLAGQNVQIAVYLTGQILEGFLPTARLWASGELMDMVQATLLGNQPTDEKSIKRRKGRRMAGSNMTKAPAIEASSWRVYRTAMLATILALSDDSLRTLLKQNKLNVKEHVNNYLERSFLAVRLSLSIPEQSSPLVTALLHEAAYFNGDQAHLDLSTGSWTQRSGPFDYLEALTTLLQRLVSLWSQLYLLVRTLSSELKNPSYTSVPVTILALAPTAINMAAGPLKAAFKKERLTQAQTLRQGLQEVREFGRCRQYEQEVILFGLKQWVLTNWDDIQANLVAQRYNEKMQKALLVDVGTRTLQESVQNSFYVFLATGVLPTTLTPSSLRLYQRTASSLLGTIKDVRWSISASYQNVFLLSAFFEALDLPNHTESLRPVEHRSARPLDFDQHRLDGGMRIVASNLSFRYPSSTKDVLSGINLTVEPGTTLAVVGFNGGGKTNLVKVLMGLYDHGGQLFVNNRPIRAYDTKTIHLRTSCLFQDFSQYTLTLRENVGIGLVRNMGDDACLQEALDRGGADGVLDKVGLDGRLNRYAVAEHEENAAQKVVRRARKGTPWWKRAWEILRAWLKRPVKRAVRWLRNAGGWVKRSTFEGERKAREKLRSPLSKNKAQPPAEVIDTPTTSASLKTPTTPLELADVRAGSSLESDPVTGTKETTGTQLDAICSADGDKPHSASTAANQPPSSMAVVSPAPLGGVRGDSTKPSKKKDTPASLSGGQWQRVALARAFMRAAEADLVVFDGPSASLDPQAEAQLFERLHSLSHQSGRKCTTIYISHRFSTVKRADQIAVLENGTLVECGPHTELLAKNGRYAELYNLQKSGFQDD